MLRKLRRAAEKASGLAFQLIGWPRHPCECPVCQRPVRRWVPLERDVGAERRRNEGEGRLCPHCLSFERTRHFWLWLEQEGVLGRRPRFLHFAPEAGLERRLRPLFGEAYVTADLFMAGVDRRLDLTRLELPDGSFDFIYCSNVLEHIPDDRAAMRELHRVLAPGGTAVVQVPIRGEVTYEDPSITDPAERARHFGQADHVRYYGRDIRERLAEAGFQVRELVMLDVLRLGPGDVMRWNLDKREYLHLCVRPEGGLAAV